MKDNTSHLLGQCIFEFLGCFTFIFLGCSVAAAFNAGGLNITYFGICAVWGLSLALAIYLSAGVSGGHLNPSVTIAFWLFGNFPKHKVIPYIIAQTLGCFCAACFVYLIFSNLFHMYEVTHNIVRDSLPGLKLASSFTTFPNAHITGYQALFCEIIIGTILMSLILALSDDKNGLPRGILTPLLIGFLIISIGAADGILTAFSLNPARDLGPRIFIYLAGWGKGAFTGYRNVPYFIVPIIGSLIGCCLGAFIYTRCLSIYVSIHNKAEAE